MESFCKIRDGVICGSGAMDEALTLAWERVKYAEARLDEEARNDGDYRYWAAYRDGVKSVVAALEQMGGGENG